jgi:primosomal protein N' (replication factor Y)
MTRAPAADSAEPDGDLVADVLLPVAVDIAYSYRVPVDMTLAAGDFVDVSLGPRETTGLVWAVRRSAAGSNLKPVLARRDIAPLRAPLRLFIDRLARWTLTPRGMALRMAMRGADQAAAPQPRLAYRASGITPERATPARLRVLNALSEGFALPKSALAQAAGCSAGVIDALVDCGALELVSLPPERVASPDPDFQVPALEPAQAAAGAALAAKIAAGGYAASLIDGVTGSGKTEVYFEAVAAALRAGGQALVLMPEIALTAQFLDRFAQRFGVRPAEWHSGVSQRKRGLLWEAVAKDEARVVVGARSALFLPFAALKLIVVDEEHESAYKQDEGGSYHARDMAVLRAQIEKAAVVLASATPSIETRMNAQTGRYAWLKLPERVGGRAQPDLAAIDLRRTPAPRGRWISPALERAVADNLARGEQSLLFLNRRGYAPLTLCKSCGHRFQCPQCTSWLVEHRFRRALVCHQCGHVERRPDACPECESVDSLTACGPGVERLADEAKILFPDARTVALSSDFPGGVERLRRELQEIAAGSVDIVIGTQLVAKGHNFPFLTLVGVIDADVGLSNSDPRAAERTFQLLQQVTGRAGRGDKPGRGLVQTFQPEHPVIAAMIAGDIERFYAEEIAARQAGRMPPFSRLAGLVVSAALRPDAESHARQIAQAAGRLGSEFPVAAPGALAGADEIAVMGPAEAPIAMVRGRHRFRLLVRAPKEANLQGFLRALLAEAPKPRGSVRVSVDVEPMSFL